VGAPEPWASGLSGDWRSAATRWAERGEPYEQALELVSSRESGNVRRGVEMLEALGASGALDALR
jgi:hypothetical protein